MPSASDFGITPDTPLLGGIFANDSGTAQTPTTTYVSGGYVITQEISADGKKFGKIVSSTPLKTGGPPPKNPIIVKDPDTGAVTAYQLTGDPNNPLKPGQQLIPPDPKKAEKVDAETAYVKQKLADAEAMAPFNRGKAQAYIDNVNSLIQSRADLDPAKIGLLEARTKEVASRAGLNAALVNKTNAQTDLYTAEGQVKLKSAFFAAQNEINNIYANVGKPGGPPTKEEADALATQIYDRAAREAATGMTAATEAANALTAQRQAVDQANNRASTSASYFGDALKTSQAMNADLPIGSDLGGKGFLALLHAAPGFQASMGGAPINLQGLPPNQQAAFAMAQGLAQKTGMPLGKAAQAVTQHLMGGNSDQADQGPPGSNVDYSQGQTPTPMPPGGLTDSARLAAMAGAGT